MNHFEEGLALTIAWWLAGPVGVILIGLFVIAYEGRKHGLAHSA